MRPDREQAIQAVTRVQQLTVAAAAMRGEDPWPQLAEVSIDAYEALLDRGGNGSISGEADRAGGAVVGGVDIPSGFTIVED